MSLHVIIGYPDHACKGLPFPVYCGPSLSDAQIAKDRHNSTAASFMEFRNAAGLRKNNPNFKPLSPAQVEVAAETEVPAEIEAPAETETPKPKRSK